MEFQGRSAAPGRLFTWDSCANNNIDITYYCVNTINYITLNTIPTGNLGNIHRFLKTIGFHCTQEGRPEHDKRHSRFRHYENTSVVAYDGKPHRIRLFLYPNSFEHTGITIKVFYPTKQIIDWLVEFFSTVREPKVSFLELTFDFFTEQWKDLERFFKSYLFMNRNQFTPKTVFTTLYASEKVVSKGMRIYVKRNLDPSPVRVELMLRRRILKGYGIELKTLGDDLNRIDFSRYFGFRRLDQEKYTSILNRRLSQEYKRKGKLSRRSDRKRWTPSMSLSLHQQITRSGVEVWCQKRDSYQPKPIGYLMDDLKRTEKQYHRFLVKFSDCEKEVFSSINGSPFWS